MKLFEQHYKTTQDIAAFINFGRGTVIGGLEGIARSWGIIREKYPDIATTKYVGPSYKAVKIFFDKALTYNFLNEMGVPMPRTKSLGKGDLTGNRLCSSAMCHLHFCLYPFDSLVLNATK